MHQYYLLPLLVLGTNALALALAFGPGAEVSSRFENNAIGSAGHAIAHKYNHGTGWMMPGTAASTRCRQMPTGSRPHAMKPTDIGSSTGSSSAPSYQMRRDRRALHARHEAGGGYGGDDEKNDVPSIIDDAIDSIGDALKILNEMKKPMGYGSDCAQLSSASNGPCGASAMASTAMSVSSSATPVSSSTALTSSSSPSSTWHSSIDITTSSLPTLETSSSSSILIPTPFDTSGLIVAPPPPWFTTLTTSSSSSMSILTTASTTAPPMPPPPPPSMTQTQTSMYVYPTAPSQNTVPAMQPPYPTTLKQVSGETTVTSRRSQASTGGMLAFNSVAVQHHPASGGFGSKQWSLSSAWSRTLAAPTNQLMPTATGNYSSSGLMTIATVSSLEPTDTMTIRDPVSSSKVQLDPSADNSMLEELSNGIGTETTTATRLVIKPVRTGNVKRSYTNRAGLGKH